MNKNNRVQIVVGELRGIDDNMEERSPSPPISRSRSIGQDKFKGKGKGKMRIGMGVGVIPPDANNGGKSDDNDEEGKAKKRCPSPVNYINKRFKPEERASNQGGL